MLMPVAYYFHNRDEGGALELSLPYLRCLARLGDTPESPEPLRFRAVLLNRALEDLTCVLARDFLDCPDAPIDEVIARYAADRLRIGDKEDLGRWLPPESGNPGSQ